MRVDNIFELVNKFSKEEDQISASFGFILKNNKRVLRIFLRRVGLKLKPRDLKQVDIETQVAYDSGESRIDLQVTKYNSFLVFIESKLYKNEEKIYEQLKKYRTILNKKRGEYNKIVRLIYVNKQPVRPEVIEKLRKKLNLSKKEFFFFSWEDLIGLTDHAPKKEIISLFRNYLGDTMQNKKIIEEQKIKNIVDVLVVYTEPRYWKLAQKKNIVVQGNSAPDARYVAFLRTHRENGMRSAITHIAEVKYTQSNVPRRESYKGFPELKRRAKDRGQNLDGTHKQYHLGKLVELSKEIPHLKGEGSKGQVNFGTKMSELLRAKTVGGIRTARQLEKRI